MTTGTFRLLAIGFVLWAALPGASAATICAPLRLEAPGGLPTDEFGAVCALSGDRAVVGARGVAARAGTVYVFDRLYEGGVLSGTLADFSGVPGDEFGGAVSLNGDVMIVGARFATGTSAGTVLFQAGAASIFRWTGTTWVQEARLPTSYSDLGNGDQFGTAVAGYDTWALVGVPSADEPVLGGTCNNCGSVHVFRNFNGQWTRQTKLVADDAASGSDFGSALAIHDRWALVGAPFDRVSSGSGSTGPGAAYVFVRSGTQWTRTQRLAASDASTGRTFGNAVAIFGNLAVVGDRAGQRAYVFRFDGSAWIEEAILQGSDTATGDRFGGNVAIFDDWVAVGAERDDDDGLGNSGSVFLFTLRNGAWVQISKLHAFDAAANDRFGSCVGLGHVLLAGAYGDEGVRGSAYVLPYPEPDCDRNGNPDACDIDADPALDADGDGTLDACECGPDVCPAGPACVTTLCVPGTNECDYALHDGFCLIGGECFADGAPNPGNVCERCDSSVNDRTWSRTPPGVSCSTSTNPCIYDGLCDGAGNCTGAPRPDGTLCPSDGLYCNGTERCIAGVCEPLGNPCLGVPGRPTCDEANDTCVVCFVDADCNDGRDCTVDRCLNGACSRTDRPAGSPCGNPADTDCDNADSCDSAGSCLPNRVADGSQCTDDGLYCSGVERCSAGLCRSSGNPCAGVPNALFCDEATDSCADCLTVADCDDRRECTTDTCEANHCVHVNLPSQYPCGNQTANECRDPDTCDGAGTCVTHFAPTETPCHDDDLVCNGEGWCSAGRCFSSGSPCPAGLTCNEERGRCECNDDGDCSDGLFCNGTETCLVGDCIDSPPPCTPPMEACKESTDTCITCQSLEDCNGNGTPDDCDLALGTSIDWNADGVPDECAPCMVTSRFRLIALDGAPAPGIYGGGYFDFDASNAPVALINNSGEVLFTAGVRGYTSNVRQGVWSTVGGQLHLVAQNTQPLPGGPTGSNLLGVRHMLLDDDGQVTFGAPKDYYLRPPYSLIYWSRPGWSGSIYYAGQQAAGMPAGVRFVEFTDYPDLAGGRNLVVAAKVSGPGVSTTNDRGIWTWRSSFDELVVRSGDPAPGTEPGVVFQQFAGPKINANGRIAFYALLTGPGVTSSNREGLWVADPGSIQLVARTDMPAPGTAPGTVIKGFPSSFAGAPTFALNDAGEVAFQTSLRPSLGFYAVDALYLGTPGNLRLVVHQTRWSGGSDFDLHTEFIHWNGLLTETRGVLFSATFVQWDGVTLRSFGRILTGDGSPPVPFPLAGVHTPGTELGVRSLIESYTLDRDTRLAFQGHLAGDSVTNFNKDAIWLSGWDQRTALLVRQGMRIDLEDYGCTTLTTFQPPWSIPNDPRWERVVNDRGEVPLVATLDGREQALLLVSPAPCVSDADCDDGDECGIDACLNGVCLSQLLPGCGLDCNRNQLSDDCDVDCGPPGGRCDRPGCGQSSDCNGDRVPDECHGDCQGNGVPDVCEILADPSLDCTGDGKLDECQITSGNDCNDSGQLDFCEIRDGAAPDCNNNNWPDHCDIEGFPPSACNNDGVLDECIRDGNCDCDYDTDLADYRVVRPCVRGPAWLASYLCRCANLDHDSDVDLADFAQFQRSFAPPPGRSRLPEGHRHGSRPPG
ncbi:MAG: FG-GAP repeat protein [Planctomycetes bacterium]|nr:FG-GAP repeat protein [Planctomycetota bacterium]